MGAPDPLLPRCFAAVVWNGDAVAPLRQVQERLQAAFGTDGWRWTLAEDLHLTLRFFGDVHASLAPALVAALRQSAPGATRHALRYEGMERWPGVIVARFAASAALEAQQAALERAAQAAGFAPETRPWAPHVTLARVSRGATAHLPAIASDPFDMPLAQAALCHRAPDGAPHRYATFGEVISLRVEPIDR